MFVSNGSKSSVQNGKAADPLSSQANPHVRFLRALQSGSVTLALGRRLSSNASDLEDAFELTLLLAAREPARFSRAAARWVGRYCVERPRVELVEAELLLSLLAALPHQPSAAARGLEELFTERGERRLAEAIRRWQVEAQPTR
jgi:hypothetical protein